MPIGRKHIETQKKYILWVGRSEDWKNPELFLRLSELNPDFKFMMICPPSTYTPRLSGRIKKKSQKLNNLKFIDLGGGFGIPYRKNDNETRLDLLKFGEKLDKIINKWTWKSKNNITLKVEPGRFISDECGILLGTVQAVKYNYNKKYIGTDIGFNVLLRPAMYNAYHDIEIYREKKPDPSELENVTIVGNICESGDIIAKDRKLPKIVEKDIIGILDAGAYCFSMSSNYNNRLRPAEVLIKENGEHLLIRKKENFADLVRGFII